MAEEFVADPPSTPGSTGLQHSEVGESTSTYSYRDIAASILLEKRARKQVEDDTVRLYNRVRQLEKEEEKAQKRIKETKAKADEITELRLRNEQKIVEREKRTKRLEERLEKQREDNFKLKQESKAARVRKEITVLESKQNVVQRTKGERAKIERLVAEDRFLSRRKALQQKETVRRSQQLAEQKIQQQRTARLQMAHDEYDRRLREEVESRFKKEKELENLVRLELDLIERLKASQDAQCLAYKQLDAALQLGKTSTRSKSAQQQRMTTVGKPKPENGEPTDQEVAQIFANYDSQGSGYVETLHIHSLLSDLKTSLKPQQLSLAISQLDPKASGKVSFGEFLLWWKG
ncbi:hypothetical protein BSKO_09302 [Bryopsis sp. KO-2023]|nr:hypothetical protein BSKO_09302 [Bryopsis sp. KO-2023]